MSNTKKSVIERSPLDLRRVALTAGIIVVFDIVILAVGLCYGLTSNSFRPDLGLQKTGHVIGDIGGIVPFLLIIGVALVAVKVVITPNISDNGRFIIYAVAAFVTILIGPLVLNFGANVCIIAILAVATQVTAVLSNANPYPDTGKEVIEDA